MLLIFNFQLDPCEGDRFCVILRFSKLTFKSKPSENFAKNFDSENLSSMKAFRLRRKIIVKNIIKSQK